MGCFGPSPDEMADDFEREKKRKEGVRFEASERLTGWVHETADYKTRRGTACQVEWRTLLHAQMLSEHPLREEVRRQLYGATEAGTDHGRAHTSVQTGGALGLVDLTRAVDGVAVVVLGADGQKGRVALETGLDKEEGGAGDGADEARRCAAEHVDGEILLGAVV